MVTVFRWIVALCLAAGAALPAAAYDARTTEINLAPVVEYLEDATGTLSITDVENQAASSFKPVTAQGDINLGYSKSTFWFRLPLAKNPAQSAQRLLELGSAELNHVAFFAPGKAPVVTGLDYPFSTRSWPHRFYVFPLQLGEQPQYFYLQVHSQGPVIVPLTLWEPALFADENQKIYLVQALYYGGLLALMSYNLLIFFSLRERGFLLYSLFACSMGLMMLSGNGLFQQFLWPRNTPWPQEMTTTLPALTCVFALYFTQGFLQTRTWLPRTHRIMHLLAGSAWAIAIAPWFSLATSAIPTALALCGMLIAGVVITTGFMAWRKGNQSARLFLMAWGVLALGEMVAGLYRFGMLPTTMVTAYALQLGSAAEMLLLSFALAERIRLERNARETAQASALSARQTLVETLRESEARLEKTVAERTAELHQSLENERTLLDRYVRFGALISHEFRNPLAIIKSQLTLIGKERERGLDNSERRLKTVASAASRLGVLFEEWLQSDRLRHHSQELARVNIPLRAWLEKVIDDCRGCYGSYNFELRMAEALPDLHADEAMLRVAIHNLVDNAAKYAPPGTTIFLEALHVAGEIGIAIIDRGPGIAPEYREQIFADYFRGEPDSEKPGSGLGLAFVKKIVDLHHGRIELKSEMGVGTGFCLWLPCNEERTRS